MNEPSISCPIMPFLLTTKGGTEQQVCSWDGDCVHDGQIPLCIHASFIATCFRTNALGYLYFILTVL